jgi:hypothetical protein
MPKIENIKQHIELCEKIKKENKQKKRRKNKNANKS